MASPMALIGMGASVIGGLTGAAGAATNAAAQKLNIQGQMMQAFGQAFQMDVQAKNYLYSANIDKYQAAVADLNKQISEQNAAYSRDVGEVEAQQAGMKAAADRSNMIASQAASGIDVSSGSSTRVRESMIELGYYDESQVRASAAKKAYGYEVEATMNEAQADIYRYTAKQNEDQAGLTKMAADYTRTTATTMGEAGMALADKGGTIGVLGSLVGATGSVASKWMQYSQSFG